jgi:hypothetical protein
MTPLVGGIRLKPAEINLYLCSFLSLFIYELNRLWRYIFLNFLEDNMNTIKGEVFGDFIIFYSNEFCKDIVDQLDLLKQICGWHGKTAKLNNVIYLYPSDDFAGQEKKLVEHILGMFSVFWAKYESIVGIRRQAQAGE